MIVLRTNPDGSVVRVKDVARVEFGARSSDRFTRFNGAPGASIGIYQSPGANAVDVTKAVTRRWTTLAKRFPDDLAYEVFFDTTVFVTATIDEVVRTLGEAFVLVGIVVFLFLGKLRTTLIPLIARAGVDHRHLRGHAAHRLHRQHRVTCSRWCSPSASSSMTPSS